MPADRPTVEVDSARTRALAANMMEAVKDHYLAQGGASQEYVYEALNAAAITVAMSVSGTAPFGVPDCLAFFSDAFTQQLNQNLEWERQNTQPGVH